MYHETEVINNRNPITFTYDLLPQISRELVVYPPYFHRLFLAECTTVQAHSLYSQYEAVLRRYIALPSD
jgi:hypothetical protein